MLPRSGIPQSSQSSVCAFTLDHQFTPLTFATGNTCLNYSTISNITNKFQLDEEQLVHDHHAESLAIHGLNLFEFERPTNVILVVSSPPCGRLSQRGTRPLLKSLNDPLVSPSSLAFVPDHQSFTSKPNSELINFFRSKPGRGESLTTIASCSDKIDFWANVSPVLPFNYQKVILSSVHIFGSRENGLRKSSFSVNPHFRIFSYSDNLSDTHFQLEKPFKNRQATLTTFKKSKKAEITPTTLDNLKIPPISIDRHFVINTKTGLSISTGREPDSVASFSYSALSQLFGVSPRYTPPRIFQNRVSEFMQSHLHYHLDSLTLNQLYKSFVYP